MTVRHELAPILNGASLVCDGLFVGVAAGRLLSVHGNLYVVLLAIALTPALLYADSIRAAPGLYLTLAVWLFVTGLSIVDWIGIANAPPAVQRAMPGLVAAIAGTASNGAFARIERRRQQTADK